METNQMNGEILRSKYGMTWYRVLSVLLIIWAITEPAISIQSLVDIAKTQNAKLYDLVIGIPELIVPSIVLVIGDAVLMILLAYFMLKYSFIAIGICKLNIIFPICVSILGSVWQASLEYGVDFAFSGSIGTIANKLIIFLPTYFYLKKRLITPFDEHNIAISKSQNTQSNAVTVDPFTFIERKLQGVTNQKDRDRIVRESLTGNHNPYTNAPIQNEAQWNEYISAYCADAEGINPVPEHIPDKRTQNEEPKENAPRFCRYCGSPLQEDSVFCEYCGKKICK